MNLKNRIAKIEQQITPKRVVVILRNDIELQSRKFNGLTHEPFVTFVNGCKVIHCLEGQNISGL